MRISITQLPRHAMLVQFLSSITTYQKNARHALATSSPISSLAVAKNVQPNSIIIRAARTVKVVILPVDTSLTKAHSSVKNARLDNFTLYRLKIVSHVQVVFTTVHKMVNV